MGTFFGVPMIRIKIYWGLDWDPLILGNYHTEVIQRSQDFDIGKHPDTNIIHFISQFLVPWILHK